MTGLQSIDAGILSEQAIAVLLLDAVVLEFAHRILLIVLREVADHGDREQRHVVGRRVVVGERAAPNCSRNACPPCPRRLALVFMSCTKVSSVPAIRSARAIVASLPDCTIMPRISSSTDTGLPNSMKVREPSERQACSLTITVLQLELAGRQLLEHDVGGHQLGEARGLHARVGVQRRQRLVGVVVDEHVGPRIDGGGARNGRRGEDGSGGKRGEQQQDRQGTMHDGRIP